MFADGIRLILWQTDNKLVRDMFRRFATQDRWFWRVESQTHLHKRPAQKKTTIFLESFASALSSCGRQSPVRRKQHFRRAMLRQLQQQVKATERNHNAT